MKTTEPASVFAKINVWFQKTIPSPSPTDIHTQAADHLENSVAFLLVCQEIGSNKSSREELGFAVNVLDFTQRRVRSLTDGTELVIDDLDRESLIRALCSQVRSCIGLAYMLEMDLEGALQEVSASDNTRLGVTGEPIFNGLNQIVNGDRFRRPVYTQFV